MESVSSMNYWSTATDIVCANNDMYMTAMMNHNKMPTYKFVPDTVQNREKSEIRNNSDL